MWLENLKELKKEKGMSTKQIAEKSALPERTVIRVFSGETERPYAETIQRIASALGASLDDVFADTNVVVMSEDIAIKSKEVDEVVAERDKAVTETIALNDTVDGLSAEVDRLRIVVEHQKEVIELQKQIIEILKERERK